MAKCKNCGADIPEGREYCESCEKEVSFPEISGIEDLFGIEEPVVEKAEEAAEQKPELSEIDDLFGAKLVENPADLFGIEGLFETETAEAPAELSGLEDIFGMESVEETELPEVDNLFETKEEVSEMSGMEDIFASLEDTSEETAAETVEQEPALSGIEDLFGTETAKESTEQSGIDDLFGTKLVEDPAELEGIADFFQTEPEDIPDLSGMENLFGPSVEEEKASAEEELPNLAGIDDLFQTEPEAAPLDMTGMEDIFSVPEESSSSNENILNPMGDDAFSLDSLLGTTEELPDDFFVEIETKKAEEPEEDKEENKKEKKKKKQKSKKEASVKEEKPKKESELYNKLFKNVPLDPSKIKEDPTPEEIAAKKKEKADKKAKEQEEKKALAEEKKAEAQRKKEEKKRLAAEKKEEKKAKKLEEAQLVLEELKTTRINKAGASIVFVFFLIIAVAIIIGTNIASYSIAMRHAEAEFDRKRYNNAYEEIYGLEAKPEEQLLYDKIMTVMYLQKQLNSYNNFMVIGEDAKALDSLVKGLQRYEKYMYLADELGITADFDYVRGQLLEAINRNFGLAEEETDRLVELYNEGQKEGSQLEYSIAIYDAIFDDTDE